MLSECFGHEKKQTLTGHHALVLMERMQAWVAITVHVLHGQETKGEGLPMGGHFPRT